MILFTEKLVVVIVVVVMMVVVMIIETLTVFCPYPRVDTHYQNTSAMIAGAIVIVLLVPIHPLKKCPTSEGRVINWRGATEGEYQVIK